MRHRPNLDTAIVSERTMTTHRKNDDTVPLSAGMREGKRLHISGRRTLRPTEVCGNMQCTAYCDTTVQVPVGSISVRVANLSRGESVISFCPSRFSQGSRHCCTALHPTDRRRKSGVMPDISTGGQARKCSLAVDQAGRC